MSWLRGFGLKSTLIGYLLKKREKTHQGKRNKGFSIDFAKSAITFKYFLDL